MIRIRIYYVGNRVILKIPRRDKVKVVINNQVVNGDFTYYKLNLDGQIIDVFCDQNSLQLSADNINNLLRALNLIKFAS